MAMDDCPSTDEVIDLNDKKKKRYPADRQKLHALLDKKEQELLELQEEGRNSAVWCSRQTVPPFIRPASCTT